MSHAVIKYGVTAGLQNSPQLYTNKLSPELENCDLGVIPLDNGRTVYRALK
jgi:hypothetical protein